VVAAAIQERMPNIAGIYGVSFKRNKCNVASASGMFSPISLHCFENRYRLVDNSILLLVCLGRSIEYAGPQRMHRAQRQNEKLAHSWPGIDKTHDSEP
jgi:hypothetical protein